MTDDEFAEFFQSYIECALWSSTDITTDASGEPLDKNYDEGDLSESLKVAFEADCARFIRENAADLAGLDAGQCGRDFWLTRNRHGAGFWDRGLGVVGERLTKAAHAYGEVTLYVTKDGEVDA